MIIAALLAALSMPPCWIVQGYVQSYGEQAAVQWAKVHGYSDRKIEEIKKACLGKR